uniref:Gustatory receptor n=1 Tax=Anopheles atroparvus TaxID=41427 RepID=A0A182J5J0_ANOAO
MLLLMYGTGQYLLIVSKSTNEILLTINSQTCPKDMGQLVRNGLVELYEQLWKCSRCFNTIFGVPIVCYLALVFLHTTTVFYMISSIFLLGKKDFTPADRVLSVSEILWAIFDMLYVMVGVIGTCSLIQDEAVLLGVVPFRFHLYPATLESRTILLSYCYIVSMIGQATRLFISVSWAWNLDNNFGFLKVTAIILYLCESMLLALTLLEMIGDKVINRLLLVSFVLAVMSGILSITFDRKAKELRVSKILVVYSMLLAVGCTVLYQSTQFLLSSARYKGGIKLTSVNLVISAIQGQVVLQTFMSAAWQRYQKRYHVTTLLKELYHLKMELFSAIELGIRWMKLRILGKIMLSQLILTSSFMLAIVELVISDHENLEQELLLLCVFYYPKVAIVYSVSLHYAVMMYLQNLHYALNERMKHLLLEHASDSAENMKGYARTQHSVYMRSKLNHLSDARCRIANCCNKTHAFYEQLLLNCCFLCMTFIVSQLYHFFEILYLSYRAQTSLSVPGLAHETLMCVLCFYELYSMMNACEMVREQSRKTQTLLLRLNVTKIDHKLKQSIEVFALQTLHQPIEFTASRMFTLDYTVLFSQYPDGGLFSRDNGRLVRPGTTGRISGPSFRFV